jgi:tetratricopeptide (TPR) repeat protein
MGLSIFGDLMRVNGDLPTALQAIREARVNLDQAHFESETIRRSSRFSLLFREGRILGAASGMSLNRPDEAIPVLQRAFDLVEEWTQNDADDAWSRLLFATVGRELGDILRQRNQPQRALAVYDHSLRRLREVKDNAEALRGQAEILAGSAYALRRLDRVNEAQQRVDTAVELLRKTNEYPAERVVLGDAAEAVLRSLGDHLAETGRLEQGAGTYEELLAKVMAAKPDPGNDLRHAVGLSHIYTSLASLHSRNGGVDRAQAVDAMRLEMWQQWEAKLPSSEVVQAQLRAIRSASRLYVSTERPVVLRAASLESDPSRLR